MDPKLATLAPSLPLVLFVAWGAVTYPTMSRAESACPVEGDERTTVATVEPRLELRLDDGRLLRLAGLEAAEQTPMDPDLADRSRAAMAALVVGRPISLSVVTNAPDRWGRLVAQAFAVAADKPRAAGIAGAAIAAGLGRYRAEPLAHPCRDELLTAESGARRATLGLWSDPYYAVLGVDDRAAFAERAGTNVLAEGRLAAVLPGPYRTRLRFAAGNASPRGGALTATILPRQMKAFEAQRVIFSSLIGRTLRLRGLLDLRFGPHIELAGPDAVEIVDDDPTTTAPTMGR